MYQLETRFARNIKYEYSVQQYQVYDELVRGRSWYLNARAYLVGYRPSAIFTVLLGGGGLIRQGACHGAACEIRIGWYIYRLHICRFPGNSGALAMSCCRTHWSIRWY